MKPQMVELAERSTEYVAANLHRLLPHIAIDVQSFNYRRYAIVDCAALVERTARADQSTS